MTCQRLLFIILQSVFVFCGCTRGQTERDRRCLITDRQDSRLRAFRELSDRHFSIQNSFSACQSNALVELETKVVLSFENHDAISLRSCVSLITNQFQHVKKWRRPEFEKKLNAYFYKEILDGQQQEVMLTADELEKILEFNFEVAVLFSQSRIRSDTYNRSACAIDDCFYQRLNKGKAYYHSIGSQVHEKTIDKWILRWIEYIESDVGTSRIQAHQMFAFETERYRKIGDITKEHPLKVARWYAKGLINCGYRPKWLDKDFPIDEAKKGERENLKGYRKDSSSGRMK